MQNSTFTQTDTGHRETEPGPFHVVHFYDNDAFPDSSIADFLWEGLQADESVVIIATPEHTSAVKECLAARGATLDALQQNGRLTLLDASATLEQFMSEGLIDWARVISIAGSVLDKAASAAPNGRGRLFGEMTALLADKGNLMGSIELEGLWNELLSTRSFRIYCAFPIRQFAHLSLALPFSQVCDEHDEVVPVLTKLDKPERYGRGLAVLQQQARALQMDITERKLAEQRQAVQYAVARVLAESATLAEATPQLLQVICESLDWEMGEFWNIDLSTNQIRCVEAWCMPSLTANEFITTSRQATFASGLGLPGRVWQSGQPEWVSDIAKEPNFLRAATAAKAGLRSAFAFPIVLSPETLGAMLFFSREIRQPDEDLLKMMSALGGQISQFIERKRAEEELRHSQERFVKIFNASPIAIGITTLAEGRFLDVNETALRALGYRREEIIGRTAFELQTWAEPEQRREMVQQLREHGSIRDFEVRVRTKTSEIREVLASVELIQLNGEPCILALFHDITERKRFEKAMLQAQKLESLGVLAGGIAHDFNNLLVGILGNAGLALMELSPESPARQIIEEIQLASERAAELVNQMLAYSGRGHFVIQPTNLNQLIEEMVHLMQASISKNVVLKFNFASNLPPVQVDGIQLRQVVMNLVVNASEAIGAGSGVITITTGAMHADRSYLSETHLAPALPEGEYVFLEVADTGSGMNVETQAKIFDPFFTTKFTGRGLGLAAVLGIVRGHHGAIKVHSEPGKGSTFKILLPSSPATDETRPGNHRNETEVKNRLPDYGKILVIDDDEMVRTVTARLLKHFGLTAIVAADGQTGLEMFRLHASEIACVLLDLTMPHPNGEEIFREIRRIKGDTPVILMSGYNEQEATSRFAGKDLAGFLKKPYSPRELHDILQIVLAKHGQMAE